MTRRVPIANIYNQLIGNVMTLGSYKKYLVLSLLLPLFMATTTTATAGAQENRIKHLEPASWWVGMQHQQLQLLVHGDNMGRLLPEISYPGISLDKVIQVDNPNYLFINLTISDSAKPGKVEIRFKQDNRLVLSHHYPLLARQPGSADRQGFGPSDVIYLLTPDRFANGDSTNDNHESLSETIDRTKPGGRHGGDIQGIINSLDYIRDMGYTAIWPNPLTENNQPNYSYHGYSATDLYRIDARFGSNEDFRELVGQARKRGIGVIQDVILNHIGSQHWWMKDIPSSGWFNGSATNKDGLTFTNHSRTTVQDPYAASTDHQQFVDGWFVDSMPDLNQQNPLVATYLIQNSIWWVEYAGLSGIREDTYSYADKTFLSEWGRRLMLEYPSFNIVGEEWSSNPITVSYWQKGKANPDGYVSHLPSLMDFPLHDAMIAGLSEKEDWGSGFVKMYEMLSNDLVYPDPFNLVIFEGNHDTPRLFSQLDEDLGLYKMALAYTLTMRGIPQLFYGTEVLMTSPKQRDDGIVRSDFPGGWAGDITNAFTGKGLTEAQQEAQTYLRTLLNWRKSATAIHDGRLMHFSPHQGTYTYFRHNEQQTVMVVMNKNSQPTDLDTRRFHEVLPAGAQATDIVSGQGVDLSRSLTVPGRSVMILEID